MKRKWKKDKREGSKKKKILERGINMKEKQEKQHPLF